MRRMGDPDYEYRPASDETRRKQSEAQRQRLGIPPGHRIIAGELAPEDAIDATLKRLYPCERCGEARSPTAAKCRACRNVGVAELKAEVLRRLEAGETAAEVRTALGITKGRVSGIAFRAGVSLRRAKPPPRERRHAKTAPTAPLPTARAEPPPGEWIIHSVVVPDAWPVTFWHSSKAYGGWWPHAEGAVTFATYDEAAAYARKKFPRRLAATPVRAHNAHSAEND